MLSKLKNHPFAIEAHFDYSVVFSFAIPKKDLEHLLPPFLTLDLFQDEFAFFTMALVKVNHLRPKGFPKLLGQDFHLIGHRLFVNYINEKGKRLRGLYILKSETDKRLMVMLGNTMTHYKYERTNIETKKEFNELIINRGTEDIICVEPGGADTALPKASVFETWKEARRFAGPLPFTFSALKEENKVLIVQGVRDNWTPIPLDVKELQLNLSEYAFMKNARLSNAFMVEGIPYQWEKGVVEIWKE